METNLITIGYAIYVPVALALTIYVARNLFKNSVVFMLDIFHQKVNLANATNKLFEIGFYLLNIGFAFYTMKIYVSTYNPVDTTQTLMETLAVKIGGFSIYLGIMLFLNMYLLFRGRRRSKRNYYEEK